MRIQCRWKILPTGKKSMTHHSNNNTRTLSLLVKHTSLFFSSILKRQNSCTERLLLFYQILACSKIRQQQLSTYLSLVITIIEKAKLLLETSEIWRHVLPDIQAAVCFFIFSHFIRRLYNRFSDNVSYN